ATVPAALRTVELTQTGLRQPRICPAFPAAAFAKENRGWIYTAPSGSSAVGPRNAHSWAEGKNIEGHPGHRGRRLRPSCCPGEIRPARRGGRISYTPSASLVTVRSAVRYESANKGDIPTHKRDT